jgi:HupE / UreJ protein
MNEAIRHPAWCYRLLINLFLGTIAFASAANAHESRPAYLEIDETAPGRYDVIWRTPVYAGMRLPIALKFSEGVSNVTEPAVRELPDSLVERRIIKASDSIAGKRIDFVGLQATITDVLVRVRLLDGNESTTVVRPSKAWVEITGSRGLIAVASSYALLGIEHILFGIDHLLFVLGLLILVKGWRRLVGTITAFTVAHSITLAAATLGFVHIPSKPVEATIALSIVFVACEIVHSRQGRSGLTEMWPWIIAFSFGLLHGLGFAGALREVGLPQNAIPVALLFFNVGVELGQLLFISFVMAVIAVTVYVAKRFTQSKVVLQSAFAWCESVSAYAIGGIAAFWLIERTLSFVT